MHPHDLLSLLARDGDVTFAVRARAGARATRWAEPAADGTLRVEIRGQAERGKANAALHRFLGDFFGVPLDHVTFIAGLASPRKTIRVTARR